MPNHRPDGPARSNQSAIVVVPFSQNPHAATFDHRLQWFDKALLNALLFFALDSDRCTPSDGRLAEMLGVSEDTVGRGLGRLQACGYVRRDKAPRSATNATGRVLILVWRTDPSVLPAVPDRHRVRLAEGTEQVEPKRPRKARSKAGTPAPLRVSGPEIVAENTRNSAGVTPAPLRDSTPAPLRDKEERSGEAFENCLSSSSCKADGGEAVSDPDRDRIMTDAEIDAETYRFEAWLAVHDCIGMTDRAERWLDKLIGLYGWETVRAAGLETRRRMDGPSPPRHVTRFLEATAKKMTEDGGAPGEPVSRQEAMRFKLPTYRELEEKVLKAREFRREMEQRWAVRRRQAQEPA